MIVVTGSTGRVGRPLINLLHGAGAGVRAVSREAEPAGLPSGMEVVQGDPSRPGSIADALDGAGSLFLHPRAVGDGAAELVDLARRRGVRRVVALSAINIDDEPSEQPSRLAGDRNLEAEEAAVGSGLEWTSLRAGFFAANTLTMWGDQIRRGDVVRYAYPNFSEAPVHEHDLASVAAQALLTDELVNRRVELTGPQTLTHAEMVGIIGDVLGRPLHYEALPPHEIAGHLVAHGMPQPFVSALMARYARLDGVPQPPSNDIEQILGRPAVTFAQWVTDHAAGFRQEQGSR
ncbi:NAD(P)H-binding protein [Microlunatus parietis]|uniref:Uncharacterized protein YbjT (DUF2867 family) n=1 Tax=Microlunatus parietis TaxID=682979 RepID=A0A7Y9LB40_9ACTN|nr:NAD(P)H-binding protein [Microlunatus parietis]NYE70215.1 uncharacterized protein YbjT (DUF2867 family) [Microlunatus parietis]